MITYLFDNNFDYNVKNKSINDLGTEYLNKIVQNSYILYIIVKHVEWIDLLSYLKVRLLYEKIE